MQSMDTKMVIAIRTDKYYENLSTSLSARLVSEAVIYAYQRGQEVDSVAVNQWSMNGSRKVVVKCPSLEELEALKAKAESTGVNYYILQKQLFDAVEPVLCVVGPALLERVDQVTGHLKLL